MNTDDHRLVLLYESMKIDRRVSKVIIIQSGKILLLQKTGSLLWELPGGIGRLQIITCNQPLSNN